jgi:hypothetical protein
MKIKDLLLTGMNIPQEARKLCGRTALSTSLTEEQLKIYTMGVDNALRAVEAILNSDEHFVIHVNDQKMPTEIDLCKLVKICEAKEKCNYD